MTDISGITKKWWPVVLAGVFMFTTLSAAIGYYARTEASKIVVAEMKVPLKRLQERYGYNTQQLEALKRNQQEDRGRSEERYKGINQKLDLMLLYQRQGTGNNPQ